MKRLGYSISFLLSVVILLSSCVYNNGLDNTVTWQRTFDLPAGNGLIQARDGDYLVNAGSNFLRLDSRGDVKWNIPIQNQVIDVPKFTVYRIVKGLDEGYALIGFGEDTNVENNNLTFVKIDESGKVENVNILSGSEFRYEVSISARDNGYTVMAVKGSFEGEKQIKVYELSTSGMIINEKTYKLVNETENLVEIIRILPNNSGYIFVSVKNPQFGNDTEIGAITKLNTDMTTSWSNPITDKAFFEIRSIIVAPDGGYVFAGTYQSIGWLFKLSPEGELMWNKVYRPDEPGKQFFFDAQSDIRGGFIAAGYTNLTTNRDNDIWIVKIDDGGDMLWEITHGSKNDDLATSILQASDGGYVVMGTIYSNFEPNPQLWLLKLNSSGEL